MSFELDLDCDADDLEDLLVNEDSVEWRPNDPETHGVFWRFEGAATWHGDGSCAPFIYLTKWVHLRSTPAGLWVVDEYANRNPEHEYQRQQLERGKKIIYNNARKKWAYPTKARAWESFRIRTSHRVQYARNNLQTAEAIYDLIRAHDRKEG